MTQNVRRICLIVSLLLSFTLAVVVLVFLTMARYLQFLFVPYQFFLIGICVGVLIAVTVGLIAERGEWGSYRVYFLTVMTSVFVLVVINSVIFEILGGEQFIQRLIRVICVVFRLS